MRVHEFAKQLGKSSKEILAVLKSNAKFDITSHMSLLSADAIAFVLESLGEVPKTKTKEKKKADVKKTAKEVVVSKKEPQTKETSQKMLTPKTLSKSPSQQSVSVSNKSVKSGQSIPLSNIPKTSTKKKPAVKPVVRSRVSSKRLPVTEIVIEEALPLFKAADLMGKQSSELVLVLLKKGIACNRNNVLSVETIEMLALQFGITVTVVEKVRPELEGKKVTKSSQSGKVRGPIVVVMGHVDHGKTTLLDYIRNMNVAAREKGGITQHISAYEVASRHGKIVFLDTPGHEAFSYLRKRGARITDIAVLVIAADDGIMPQTIEAIKHAREAEVPIIVAINKVDKVEVAAVESVKRQLAQQDLMVEDWGGQTICVSISAKTGKGVDDLLEMLVLQAEIMELKAEPEKLAKAFVLESHLEKGYGPVASVICTEGSLKQGDYFTCGASTGKVRLLVDTYGKKVKEVGPSTPVQVIGFNDFAATGDWLQVVSSKDYLKVRSGRGASAFSGYQSQELSLTQGGLEGQKNVLHVIIKTDTQGSQEAIIGSIAKLKKLSIEVGCPIVIVSTGIGDITENDIMLASSTGSILFGFHVKVEKNAQTLAKAKSVTIKIHGIIYKLIEELEEMLQKRRKIEVVWKKSGQAVVRKIFPVKGGVIAGCYLQEGVCSRDSKVSCVRDGNVIGEGKITSLQRERKAVKEIHAGYEFGFLTDTFHDWQEEDIVHCFTQVKEKS